jgi:hypothetical protein
MCQTNEESPKPNQDPEDQTDRDTWGNPIEFLLSCISMSVGLGMYKNYLLNFKTHLKCMLFQEMFGGICIGILYIWEKY